MKILVVGASGSGSTTLGAALASARAGTHLDLDDYYWVATSPPYQQKRDANERLRTLSRDMQSAGDVIVSGSLVGWGSEVEDAFDLIVFLYVATPIRLQRLRERETARFGVPDPAFLEWASQYDEGPPEGRSLKKHEAWLAERSCAIVRIDGDTSVDERVKRVLAAIASSPPI